MVTDDKRRCDVCNRMRVQASRSRKEEEAMNKTKKEMSVEEKMQSESEDRAVGLQLEAVPLGTRKRAKTEVQIVAEQLEKLDEMMDNEIIKRNKALEEKENVLREQEQRMIEL